MVFWYDGKSLFYLDRAFGVQHISPTSPVRKCIAQAHVQAPSLVTTLLGAQMAPLGINNTNSTSGSNSPVSNSHNDDTSKRKGNLLIPLGQTKNKKDHFKILGFKIWQILASLHGLRVVGSLKILMLVVLALAI